MIDRATPETMFRLYSYRCGHEWMTMGERPWEDVKMCPSCKSCKWREVPKLVLCKNCGAYHINEPKRSNSRCPVCGSRTEIFNNRCEFCKTSWSSVSDKKTICPICGKPSSNTQRDRTVDIWSDGRF